MILGMTVKIRQRMVTDYNMKPISPKIKTEMPKPTAASHEIKIQKACKCEKSCRCGYMEKVKEMKKSLASLSSHFQGLQKMDQKKKDFVIGRLDKIFSLSRSDLDKAISQLKSLSKDFK